MLNPIVFVDSEIGSSVDTVWAELYDEEGLGRNYSLIDEQVSFHLCVINTIIHGPQR